MKFFYLIFLTLILSCNINNIEEIQGVSNLKFKINNLKYNISNLNDVQSLLGPPILKDPYDQNIWSYFEIRNKKNLLGNKILILNDVLIIKFNSKGILTNYELFDIKNLNKIEFSKAQTKVYSFDDSLVANMLSSTRKRWEMSRNRNNKPSEQ